jgi:hypothetical protein
VFASTGSLRFVIPRLRLGSARFDCVVTEGGLSGITPESSHDKTIVLLRFHEESAAKS